MHRSALPFSYNSSNADLHFIQVKVLDTIHSPSFVFQLPELSQQSWDHICNDIVGREGLEFLGDALMGKAVAEELFRIFPGRTPGFYTKSRAVLVANSTFAHLMHKVDFHDMEDPVKPAGDAFETIIAAYEKERGFKSFHDWFLQYFLPLVEIAGSAWKEYSFRDIQQRRKLHNQLLSKLKSKPSHHRGHLSVYQLRGKSTLNPPRRMASLFPPQSKGKLETPAVLHKYRPLPPSSAIDISDGSDIEEISSDAFYQSQPPQTAALCRLSPIAGPSRTSEHLLCNISRSYAVQNLDVNLNSTALAPSPPLPSTSLAPNPTLSRPDIDQELADCLQRTPMLGSATNPIAID